MTDDPATRSDATEPPGEAARAAGSKSTGPRPLATAEAEDQEKASQSDDDDVDVVVDKTDMSAVGDDGQVFGG